MREQSVIICCGAGGVGKTTSAASLGVLAARSGRSTVVMTIDPAKRLAQAMGLDSLNNDPQSVALEAPGSLSAMMLDTKRTFDHMVETYAPDDRVRDTIFCQQLLPAAFQHTRRLPGVDCHGAGAGDSQCRGPRSADRRHAARAARAGFPRCAKKTDRSAGWLVHADVACAVRLSGTGAVQFLPAVVRA